MTSPTAPTVSRYGAWPSPLSAEDVARAGVRLGAVTAVGEDVWWTEGRPAEGGRQVVTRAGGDVLPAPWNARTRVHEYGGACWLAVPTEAGHALVFSEWSDQRLYRLDAGSEPQPLTPEPPTPSGWRYADPVLSHDGTEVWCVRETDTGRAPVTRAVVAVPLDGSGEVREVVADSDFLAFPRISPDGRRLAWIAWDHPRMPWDGTELRVGELDDEGVVDSWLTILGGATESVLQPEWTGSADLFVVSDRSGWWNLYRLSVSGGAPTALCPREEEFGAPLWQLGQTTYAVLGDGRIAALHGRGAAVLGVLDLATGTLTDLDLAFTDWRATLSASGATTVLGIAGSPTAPDAAIRVDLTTGGIDVLRSSLDAVPDAAFLPVPRPIVANGPGGRDVHAFVYPPTNPDVVAADGERPPYIVFVHGGPTAHSRGVLDLEKAYFTSRGIGVIDVNYGGSTGYGRAYRERLRQQWGVVDVEDCVAAVRHLADVGQADGDRLAIRGGSAGGWTTLAALTTTDAFACGTSYFGVAELLRFAQDTHDFESRYLDGLIGRLPEDHDVYVARAPLSHVDELSCPVLLLQGLEDKVVPPSQAEMFRDALLRKAIPHAYLAFEGEQHGFRKVETITAALQAELSFYGQIFGFTPPGVPLLNLVTGS